MKYQTLSKQTISAESTHGSVNGGCTVCLIESNRLAAEYLAGILREGVDIDVCFFDQFVESGSHKPPLVFCLDQADAVLPLRASLKLLQRSYPDSRSILLDAESRNEPMSFLLESGIHGFLKHVNVKEWLVEAVRSVAKGLLWMHPEFSRQVPPLNRGASENAVPELLTRREGEILHLVTNHFSNKEIAKLLEIEESTVKFHLSNILAKRNVSRREDLSISRISGGWKRLLLAETGADNPALRSLLK